MENELATKQIQITDFGEVIGIKDATGGIIKQNQNGETTSKAINHERIAGVFRELYDRYAQDILELLTGNSDQAKNLNFIAIEFID